MLDPVIKLAKTTQELLQHIENVDYETLMEFIDMRGLLIEELQQVSMSEEEKLKAKEVVQQILASDSLIQDKMVYLRNEAQKELAKLNVAKRNRDVYEAGYNGDSLFFDSKK
jgi:hypothetical protein